MRSGSARSAQRGPELDVGRAAQLGREAVQRESGPDRAGRAERRRRGVLAGGAHVDEARIDPGRAHRIEHPRQTEQLDLGVGVVLAGHGEVAHRARQREARAAPAIRAASSTASSGSMPWRPRPVSTLRWTPIGRRPRASSRSIAARRRTRSAPGRARRRPVDLAAGRSPHSTRIGTSMPASPQARSLVDRRDGQALDTVRRRACARPRHRRGRRRWP